jgi:hypothetical protein
VRPPRSAVGPCRFAPPLQRVASMRGSAGCHVVVPGSAHHVCVRASHMGVNSSHTCAVVPADRATRSWSGARPGAADHSPGATLMTAHLVRVAEGRLCEPSTPPVLAGHPGSRLVRSIVSASGGRGWRSSAISPRRPHGGCRSRGLKPHFAAVSRSLSVGPLAE